MAKYRKKPMDNNVYEEPLERPLGLANFLRIYNRHLVNVEEDGEDLKWAIFGRIIMWGRG